MDVDLSVLQQYNKPGGPGKQVMYMAPRNPADKTTIVSVYPRLILEMKTTIFPTRYEIPPAEPGDFSLLVLEGASYFIPSSVEKMPPTEIQVNSAELARSITEDFLSAVWLSKRGERGPGVFWIPGEWNKKSILSYSTPKGKNFIDLLNTARESQKQWFKMLVDAADELWARSGGNPRAIPEDSKMAAEHMGIDKSKPWMQNTIAASLEHCPYCGEMIDLNYPICKYCHKTVNVAKATELDKVFAGITVK